MKSIVKVLLVSAALTAMPTAANASECKLGGSHNLVTPRDFGINAETTPLELVNKLIAHPRLTSVMAVCKPEQVVQAFLLANNGKFNDPAIKIAADFKFSIPAPLNAKPAAEQQKAEASAATAGVAAAPVKEPTPTVEAPQVKEAKAAVIAAKRERAAVQAVLSGRPAATWSDAEKQRLAEAEAKVTTAEGKLEKLRLAVGHLVDHAQASNQWNGQQDEQIANANAVATNALEKAEEANAAAANATLPMWAKILLGLAFVAAIIAGAIAWFRKPSSTDVEAAVKTVLETDGLSHTTLKADVEDLKQKFEELSTDVADAAKDRKQIELPADLVDTLNALPEGQSTDVSISINGERGLIGFTKHNDTQVMAHDIDKQTQAMNIDGICSKINKAIGGGRVKMRPIAKVVNG